MGNSSITTKGIEAIINKRPCTIKTSGQHGFPGEFYVPQNI